MAIKDGSLETKRILTAFQFEVLRLLELGQEELLGSTEHQVEVKREVHVAIDLHQEVKEL